MTQTRAPMQDEERIARRAALELRPGMLVNLGIGLPTLVPQFLPADVDVLFHSENGFVGMGPALEDGTPDHDIIDAGGRACTIIKGGAFFDSLLSFAIVRGGHLDLAVLGAFEVSIKGDLANWKIPGRLTPGMGGGMELAQKANQVLVVTRHLDKKGRPKIVRECSLPLTARHCVDTVITERAVFRRRDGALALISVHPDHTIDSVLEGIEVPMRVIEPLQSWDQPPESPEGVGA
ncbi:MAG: 3-oxoacid CoA-transferase subunit B [Planctomycetota bacterium]|nr:3-oxoacid CoA-transferase subunit B [Planctomycetota bacterium]